MLARYLKVSFRVPVGRSFSSTPDELKKEATKKFIKEAFTTRLSRFILLNKQHMFNILGSFLVASIGVHYWKVNQAWEHKQREVDIAESELQKLRDEFLNEEWIKKVEAKVKSSKEPVLQKEIGLKIKEFFNEQEEAFLAAETKLLAPGSIKTDEPNSKNTRTII